VNTNSTTISSSASEAAATSATSSESREAKRARLREAQAKREQALEDKKLDADIERLELVEKYERDLGPEGQAFAIYDASHVGEGFFVVKHGEAVLYTTFMESKLTPADRYDFVAPCIVHPTREKFDAAQARRPGINVELSNRLVSLYGIKLKTDEGK
jgi:hypothetical protein